MVMERTGIGMPGVTMTGATGMVGSPSAMPAGTNMMMVPRCALTFEKCKGGVKVTCSCEEKVSAGMLRNLCTRMASGLCSCSCVMNGMMVCC
jgi:hypothetical protein